MPDTSRPLPEPMRPNCIFDGGNPERCFQCHREYQFEALPRPCSAKEPGYYSRELKMPATKKDGLMNFIQMVINQLEAGNPSEALYIAVDLLNDVMCGNYDQAITCTRNTTASLHKELEAKHLEQLAKERKDAYADGQRDARQEIAKKLGLV